MDVEFSPIVGLALEYTAGPTSRLPALDRIYQTYSKADTGGSEDHDLRRNAL